MLMSQRFSDLPLGILVEWVCHRLARTDATLNVEWVCHRLARTDATLNYAVSFLFPNLSLSPD